MDELLNIAKKVVPTLVPMLGVPKLAGDVISSISNVLFGEDKPTEEVIQGLANATPDQIIALEGLRNQFELRLVELANEDKASARNMQVEALRQEDKTSKHFVYYFAWFWSTVATLYIFGITFLDVPPANTRVVDTVLGFILGTVVAAILQYFYGSSTGSKAKDKLTDKQ